MIMVYDAYKRGWVDNAFPESDEFWLCEEPGPRVSKSCCRMARETNMTIFLRQENGEEPSDDQTYMPIYLLNAYFMYINSYSHIV